VEQLVFLLIIGLISLIQWLVRKSQEAREAQDLQMRVEREQEPSAPARRLAPRPEPESEQERIRRFLEALGVPESEAPPPPVTPAPREKVAPRPEPEWPRPTLASPPQPAAPPPIPARRHPAPVRRAATRPRLIEEAEGPAGPPLVPPTPVFVAKSKGIDVASTVSAPSYTTEHLEPIIGLHAEEHGERPAPKTALAEWLGTRESLRAAVVARELLGPPRALAPFESVAVR
jgi:hypothetical protein